MFWIIFTLILGLVGLIAFGVARGSDPAKGENRLGAYAVAALCGIVWVVITVFSSMYTVGQLQRGIIYNFSGTISGRERAPGWGLHAPWQHVKTENVGIQHLEYDLATSNSAVSKDQQPIFAKLAVNLRVEPTKIVDLYKRVGPDWQRILLESRVLQDFKEITATYETVAITNQREKLRRTFRERLRKELEGYDVRVVDVFVKNIGFSEAYANAIEQKQVQVQEAAQARAKVAQAVAEADQKIAEARGEATSITLKGNALKAHPEVLRLRAIETLNPNAQVIICTGKTCPSFLPQFGGK